MEYIGMGWNILEYNFININKIDIYLVLHNIHQYVYCDLD